MFLIRKLDLLIIILNIGSILWGVVKDDTIRRSI